MDRCRYEEVYNIRCHHREGLPENIVSDNGPNFTSAEIEDLLTKNGIKHTKVSPHQPASNGQAERAVRVFKEGIEKMEGGNMQNKLSRFLLKYRATPHSTTGVTPAQLLMKKKIRTRLDLLLPNIASQVRLKQGYQKHAHNYHAKERDLDANAPVFLRDFSSSSPKSWQKGTIVHTSGPVSALIELPDGRVARRHQDHLRKDPSIAEHSLKSSTPEPDMAAPDPIRAEPMCDRGSTPKTAEVEPLRSARNRRLPVRFKDYELKH